MGKHPSRYLIIESQATGEKYRLDPMDMPVPTGFIKVTGSIPAPEKYWSLPVYKPNH